MAVAEYELRLPSARAYDAASYDLESWLKEARFRDSPRKGGDPSLVPPSESAGLGSQLYLPGESTAPARGRGACVDPWTTPSEARIGAGIEVALPETGFQPLGLRIYSTLSPAGLLVAKCFPAPAGGVERGAEVVRQEAALPPLIQQAIDAFENDLPRLLESHRGQWVVYRGGEHLGFGTSKTALLQAWYARGYPDEDLYVRRVEESPPIHFAW